MNRRYLAFILIATTVVFARVCTFEFLSWDDRIFIFENPVLKMSFPDALSTSFTNFFFGDYLPLTQLSLWLDTVWTGQPNATVSHAVNLILHLLNIVLLFTLLRRETVRGWLWEGPAAVILLLFALHPLQVESVAWISERKGLLSATFALAALNFFIHARSTSANGVRPPVGQLQSLFAYTVFFLASTLAKTSNLALPLVALLYDRAIAKTKWRSAVLTQIPALTIAALVGGIRVFAYANLTTGMGAAFTDSSRWPLLPIQIANAIGFYLRQMLFPFQLSPIYQSFQLNWLVLLNVGLFIAFAVLAYISRRQNPAASILFLTTIFLLLPVLQIIPRLSYVNDRYFYMPLWAAAGAFMMIPPAKPFPIKILGLAPFAFLLGMATFSQLDMWRDDLSFWSKTVRLRPESGVAFLSLGQAYEKSGEIKAASAAYLKASELGPEVRARALSNLSSLHANADRKEFYDLNQAELYMQSALKSPEIRSERPGLLYNLARIKFLQGQVQEAQALCQEILKDIEQRKDLRFESVAELARTCFQTP